MSDKMKIVGLTGGIASGKTTVAKWFEEENIPVIDSDFVYKELSKPGGILYNSIKETFGEKFISSDGTINKSLLGEMVFRNPEELKKLNHLTHPKVKSEILRQLELLREKQVPLVIVVVPLLFETDFVAICQRTICVYVKREVQIERLMNRDKISFAYAVQKINAQMPLEKKKDLADYVIYNTFDSETSKQQFYQILKDLRSE